MQKVLIAEDDAILREILMGKLTTAGYLALGAEDGDTALRLIKAEKPDIILLDILIPRKNGIEVMREMQQDTTLKNIPVIAISNSDDADSIREAKALGAKDFLIKAIFDSSDVLEKVNQMLRTETSKTIPQTPEIINTKATNINNSKPMDTTNTTPTQASKTIFIVEDDKFLREIAAQKLETEGFKLASATTGNEALEYLEKNPRPDIVLLDLILPGMSGFEVLASIKANPVLKDIPVLILSNLGQEEDIEKAKKLGARDYLVKAHFSFAEIIKKIHEIVG
ncbi:MAG TPA: response regulator [Candidatus Paceibacterota bacterium]